MEKGVHVFWLLINNTCLQQLDNFYTNKTKTESHKIKEIDQTATGTHIQGIRDAIEKEIEIDIIEIEIEVEVDINIMIEI